MKRDDPDIEIVLRRERLLAQCAAQRDDLALLAERFDGPLQVADRVLAGVNYCRRHPLQVGVVVVLLTVVQRRRLWRWVRGGFVLWRTYRAIGKSRFKSVF